VIADAFRTAPGLVFGESHSSLAAFRTLYDNVDVFVQNKVKKLFVEGLVYDKIMRWKDDGMGRIGLIYRPPNQRPTLGELLKKFEDNGIEIVPLDHFYLTRHNDERTCSAAPSRRLSRPNDDSKSSTTTPPAPSSNTQARTSGLPW